MQFDYKKYQTPGVTLVQLDDLMHAFLNTNSKFEVFSTGVKLVVILAYLYARYRLVDELALIEKQSYEQEETNKNRIEVNSDPLVTS